MMPQEELIEQRKENEKLLKENLQLRGWIKRDMFIFIAVVLLLAVGCNFAFMQFEEMSKYFADVAQNAHETLEYETKIVHAYGMIIDDYDRLVEAHNALAQQVAQQEHMWSSARRQAARYGVFLFPEDAPESENTHEGPDFPEFPEDEEEDVEE